MAGHEAEWKLHGTCRSDAFRAAVAERVDPDGELSPNELEVRVTRAVQRMFYMHGVSRDNHVRGARNGLGIDHVKAICADCPVMADCLEYALGDPYAYGYGIWGGTTYQERVRIRATRERSTGGAA